MIVRRGDGSDSRIGSGHRHHHHAKSHGRRFQIQGISALQEILDQQGRSRKIQAQSLQTSGRVRKCIRQRLETNFSEVVLRNRQLLQRSCLWEYCSYSLVQNLTLTKAVALIVLPYTWPRPFRICSCRRCCITSKNIAKQNQLK